MVRCTNINERKSLLTFLPFLEFLFWESIFDKFKFGLSTNSAIELKTMVPP